MLRSGLGLLVVAALALGGCEQPQVPAHLRVPGADPERGRALVQAYGCVACHVIEGIPDRGSPVGPPLQAFAVRTLIAGAAPNVPRNLVRWLRDPPAMAPGTAMPNLGLGEAEARDIASFLYTQAAARARILRPEAEWPLATPEAAAALRGAQMRRLAEETAPVDGYRRVPIERAMEALSRGQPGD